MKTAIYLFILITLFNSFSEPHERVRVHIQFYKNGNIVLSDYSDKYIDRNSGKLTYDFLGKKRVIPDSIVYTCGIETKYNPLNPIK